MITRCRALGLALSLVFGTFLSLPAAAQDTQGVGVVTTLTGEAAVARPTRPQPQPLHFKDDVFGRDRISTAEKSLVRVLLGGKAVITVRELSVLTITEDMGHAEVNLQSGKIALAVARQRMKPGESITLRARNAVAAIRGTVVIAEILTATAQAGQPAQASAGIGVFHVLNGSVEVTPPGANTFLVGPGQSGDGTGRVWTRTPAEDLTIRQGLTTDQRGGPPANVWQQQQEQAAALGEVVAPDRDRSDFTIPANTICPPTCPVSSLNRPPPPSSNLIQNPGAEDVLANWNPTGATSSNPTFGFINSPEGHRMFTISTGSGSVNGTTSTLSQGFSSTGGSVFALGFRSAFVSNEFPTQNPFFNDTFRATAIDSAGNQVLLAMESRNTSAFNIATQPINIAGFTTNAEQYGVTDFRTWARTWVTTTTDSGTLQFQIFDVGDTVFDSAALIDSVFAYKQTPVFLVRNGAEMGTTGPGPLAEWVGQPPVSFDSLMVVCCQGSVTLGAQLLHAKNTDLDVPFSLLSVVQGGRLRSTSTDSVVLLEGGSHTIGTQVAMFDLSGANSTLDPETGRVLGTARPLSLGFHSALFEASGAQVSTRKVVQLDTGILEATAPLIWAHNGSNITTSQDAIDLTFRARVTALGTVVKLDASTLTVANGSAINVAASSLRVIGDLFTLLNGSTLKVLNGALLNASGGANVFVSGALVAFGGTGGNLVSVANNFCPCASIGGIPVALAGGATTGQVSIGPGAIKNAALGSVTPSMALIRVLGPTTRVTIGGGS